MAEENVTLHKTADPVKVKLIKGQKDTYGWEISIQGDDNAKCLHLAYEIDIALRETYKLNLGRPE